MNISISEALAAFAQEQASQRGYATISEYMKELIRKDQERQAMRRLLNARNGTPGTAASPGLAALRARMRLLNAGREPGAR
jgi:antitoxin ParD1/3/4